MKVLFLTNVPSPYRVAFFNELGKLCDLTVLFEKDTSDERDASWKKYTFETFSGIILNGRSVKSDAAFCPGVIKYVSDCSYDIIICANVSSPTGMLAIQYMKMKGIPYWIEGDGAFAKSGKGFKESVKRYIISGAAGYFSTSREHDKYYLAYGAKRENIYRYPFTSLYAKDILQDVLAVDEKAAFREELEMAEEKVVVAVGQFIKRKGFDVLLRAAGRLPRNIGFYFVGGEPAKDYLELQKKLDLCDNVHFVGFCSKERLSKYYKAANLFVLPTREDIWGLVVNEAMAHGIPIISTERCGAALELVTDGQNGYIVPVEDDVRLAEKILLVLGCEELREHMAEESLRKIRMFTYENMAASHIAILKG